MCLLETLIFAHPLKKLLALYAARRFINVFTRINRRSVAKRISSTVSHSVSLKFILTLSSHFCLRHPLGLLPLHIPRKLYIFSPHVCYVLHPPHHPCLIILITLTEENKLWDSLYSPVSCYFFPLSSEFSPERLIFSTPWCTECLKIVYSF